MALAFCHRDNLNCCKLKSRLQMNTGDGIGFIPPEQNPEVTSSTQATIVSSDSKLQEVVNFVKAQATVEKIGKLVLDPKTVHDSLELTVKDYIERHLESDEFDKILDEMLKRDTKLKEDFRDTPFSSGQKTLVEKQDGIARELLASSTVMQQMDFRKMLDDFKQNHIEDSLQFNAIQCLDKIILAEANNIK